MNEVSRLTRHTRYCLLWALPGAGSPMELFAQFEGYIPNEIELKNAGTPP